MYMQHWTMITYGMLLYVISMHIGVSHVYMWYIGGMDTLAVATLTISFLYTYEKSNIPFSYMLYAYSVKRAYRGTKPKESFR